MSVRLRPSLTFSKAEADAACEVLQKSLQMLV
jgi:4-aminobutyrate aminotransferase-like enzyme